MNQYINSYCVNPFCHHLNEAENILCSKCGIPLTVKDFRIVKCLTSQPVSSLKTFEVRDINTSQHKILKVLYSNEEKPVSQLTLEASVLKLLNAPPKVAIGTTVLEAITGIPKVEAEFTWKLNQTLVHCLILDKIEGITLSDWLSQGNRCSQHQAIDWMTQIASKLKAIHQLNFIHRDISPMNVILQPDGNLAVIDFSGVCQLSSMYITQLMTKSATASLVTPATSSDILFTPGYTAPEQIDGMAIPRSDLFALGRLMCHLVTGYPPRQIRKDPKNQQLLWRQYAPHLETPVANLIDSLMAPSFLQRPLSAEHLLDELKALPTRLKRQRFWNSTPVRFIGTISITISVVIGFQTWINQRNLLAMNQHLNQALLHQQQRQHHSAIQEAQQALQIEPNNELIHAAIALSCAEIQDFNCAEQHYRRVMQLNPKLWEAHYNLADLYEQQNKLEAAIQQYQLVAENAPKMKPDALNNWARVEILRGNLEIAARKIQEALSSTQDSITKAALYKNLGWLQLQQKRYAEATQSLQKSLSFDSRTDTYCLLAQTKDAQGQVSLADWVKCLQGSADLPEIKNWQLKGWHKLLHKSR